MLAERGLAPPETAPAPAVQAPVAIDQPQPEPATAANSAFGQLDTQTAPGLQRALPDTADQWIDLYGQLPLSGMLKSICGQLAFRGRQADCLMFDIDAAASGVLSEKYQLKFQQLLIEHLGIDCQVRIDTGEQQSESPVGRAARQRREALQTAEQEILQSPLAQALQREFSARLVPGSVELVGTTEGQSE